MSLLFLKIVRVIVSPKSRFNLFLVIFKNCKSYRLTQVQIQLIPHIFSRLNSRLEYLGVPLRFNSSRLEYLGVPLRLNSRDSRITSVTRRPSRDPGDISRVFKT